MGTKGWARKMIYMNKNIMKQFVILLLLLSTYVTYAHTSEQSAVERIIKFPDLPGYKTMKCDFHQHTVFSDGNVWPNIRVEEASKDGLDAIAITDHIEYQRHGEDIPNPDRNRSYQIAKEAAKGSQLIVINGAEISRDMPPGHANAIFLEDVNKLNVTNAIEAYEQAKQQGAFIFWNHPNWISQKKDGIAKLTDTHRMLLDKGLLHGIEVVNDDTYSDEALQIALDNDLTVVGNSDIHGLIDWRYEAPFDGHRPVTLVFAKERSIESIKEALNEKRTAVWFNNLLIGREEHIKPLILASLNVVKAAYIGKTTILEVKIQNNSDAEYILENLSDYTFHANANLVKVLPHATTTLQVKTLESKEAIKLQFKVMNAVIAPQKNPEITLEVNIKVNTP